MSCPGLYDPTTIMNADILAFCQKEGWCKLAFYLLSFFYYLYGYKIILLSFDFILIPRILIKSKDGKSLIALILCLLFFLGKCAYSLSCPELDKRIKTNILRLQPAAKIKDFQICLQSLLHFGFSCGVSASPGQEITGYIIPL